MRPAIMKNFLGKLQLSVTVAPDDNAVKVIVADNGKGFDPALVENRIWGWGKK